MAFVYKDDGARAEVHSNLKGAINEHIATAWLLKKGYDVFRNVSPRGRADLFAVDWDKKERIPVDVKSEQFDLDALTPMGEGQRQQSYKYEESGIKYLVVSDDGSCRWYEDPARERVANDNYWKDPTTGQRFLHPRNDMSHREWSFFCQWLVTHHKDKMADSQIDFATLIAASTRRRSFKLNETEKENLRKIHRCIFRKITGNEDAA